LAYNGFEKVAGGTRWLQLGKLIGVRSKVF